VKFVLLAHDRRPPVTVAPDRKVHFVVSAVAKSSTSVETLGAVAASKAPMSIVVSFDAEPLLLPWTEPVDPALAWVLVEISQPLLSVCSVKPVGGVQTLLWKLFWNPR
jgi:hypothetical protein